MGSENRNKTGFRLCGVETHTRPWLRSFRSTACPDSDKTCFSHTVLDCRHESSPHRARIMTKLGGCVFY